MKPDEIRHLLGGYATGTLTPQEQAALFEAALQDQQLFDELAREQVLREALETPAARVELRQALEERQGWWEEWRRRFTWQVPVAAGALAAAVLTVVGIRQYSSAPKPMVVAQNAVHQSAEPVPPPVTEEAPHRAAPARSAPKMKALRMPAEQPAPAARREPLPAPAVVPSPASPAAPPAEVRQPARDADVTGLRSSMVASEQTVKAAEGAARDLFDHAAPSSSKAAAQQTRAPQGITGGVVGGVPGGMPASAARAPMIARAVVSTAPLGLRYSGRQTPGAPPQLVVESTVDATLYVFRRDETGAWLPVTVGGISLKAKNSTTTPAIDVNGNAPPPRVLLILSRSPLTELAASGPALTAAVERLRIRNDMDSLVTETGGGSTYVVLPAPGVGAILAIPVALP